MRIDRWQIMSYNLRAASSNWQTSTTTTTVPKKKTTRPEGRSVRWPLSSIVVLVAAFCCRASLIHWIWWGSAFWCITAKTSWASELRHTHIIAKILDAFQAGQIHTAKLEFEWNQYHFHFPHPQLLFRCGNAIYRAHAFSLASHDVSQLRMSGIGLSSTKERDHRRRMWCIHLKNYLSFLFSSSCDFMTTSDHRCPATWIDAKYQNNWHPKSADVFVIGTRYERNYSVFWSVLTLQSTLLIIHEICMWLHLLSSLHSLSFPELQLCR